MNSIARFGFWAALASFLGGAGYSIVQVLQVFRQIGPPIDAILIYGFSLLIAVPFMLAMLALYYDSPTEKKLWAHAALLFSVMYATYVSVLYFAQLGTGIPLSIQGISKEAFEVNRNSFFWAQDGLGYVCMGLATLFASRVFTSQKQRWLRRFFFANGVFTVIILFIYFYPNFSENLLFIGLPWIITGPGSIFLLMRYFQEKM